MHNPSDDVDSLKRALGAPAAGSEATELTGVDPVDQAIAIVRRHPVVVLAALGACGFFVARSAPVRAGLRRAAGASLRALATGMVLKTLGE